MVPPRPVPGPLRGRPFTVGSALPHVGRHALAGASYQRLLPGVFAAADLAPDHDLMLAALRLRHPRAVLAGPTAAWAHGCRMADIGDPVHVAVRQGDRNGAVEGLVRHRMQLCTAEIVDTRWGPATSPARTAVDLARGLGIPTVPLAGRVAWVDALLAASGLGAAEARQHGMLQPAARGIEHGRLVLRLARDGVGSPRETHLRLLVRLEGFPEPVVQCPVELDGRVIARLDLGWPRHRAGLEYDGAVHQERRQHSRDLGRHNTIRAAGWTALQVDSWALARPLTFLDQLARVVPRARSPRRNVLLRFS